MTFSSGEINAILRDELQMDTVLPRDYSDEIVPTLRNNYHNVRSSITTAPNRFCSEFQVRLANLRPTQYANNRNYWPEKIGDHYNFVKLVKSILLTQFAANRTCVHINFSISLLILDPSDPFTPVTFLWSSRGNNACLDNAFSIESMSTLNQFIDDVLSPFSIENQLLGKLEELEEKYSGILIPISANFYLTLNTATIFGARKAYTERCLSDNECGKVGVCHTGNDCVWEAISSVITLDNEQQPVTRHGIRKRCNQKIAKRLKVQFIKWYKSTSYKNDLFGDPVCAHGYDSRFFPVLEKFLKMGIVLVDNVQIKKKRISFYGLVNTDKRARCLKVKYSSKEKSTDTLFLATNGRNHIQCVTNLPAFAHKIKCSDCGRSFRYACELKKHKCKREKFRDCVLQKWNYSLSVGIEKTLSMENRLKSDTKYMHVLLNGMDDGCSVRVKMCFSLLGNDILTKTVLAPNMQYATEVIVKNATKAALFVLGERLIGNYALLKKVEGECNDITIKSDPLVVENILNVKKCLVEFLSTFACYIQTDSSDIFVKNGLMHTMVSTLSDSNECGNFHVRFGRNVLQGVSLKSHPVKYMALGEYASSYNASEALDSHVVDWANVISKFQSHFGLNITGMTPGQIGHHLLANSMTSVEKRAFLTSPVAFQQRTFSQNVRYGLLSFDDSNVVSPDSEYKSVVSADFSKFYFSILVDPEARFLTVGLPVRYEERGGTGIFVPEKTRRRKTQANLFLRLVEEVFNTQTVCLLHSKEVQFDGKPVDGYCHIDGTAWIIEYHGCSVHGYQGNGGNGATGQQGNNEAADMHNGMCHLPKSVLRAKHASHLQSCDVCRADASREFNVAKPSLWHLHDNETPGSFHFFHKKSTYTDLYKLTMEKGKNIEEAGFKLMAVWDCTMLKFWHRPVREFFAQWQLQVNSPCADEQLGKLMGRICVQSFPLSRHPFLTQHRIIDCIRQKTLNGFVTLSCQLGPKSQAVLQSVVKPFFYKDKNGNARQSYDIERKCVSTCLLHELLTNNSFTDFSITKIYDVFEYQLAQKNPFSRLKIPVQNALSAEGSSTFSKLVKITINRSIGCLNFNSSRHKKSILIQESDIPHLNSPSNLSHCTRIGPDKVLMHLQNDRPISNASHMHLGIVATGVALMLQFFCGIRSFLTQGVRIQRINTDGLVLKCTTGHFPSSTTELKNLSLVFDKFLKRSELTANFVDRYIHWKKRFFKHLGFCPNHEKLYADFILMNNTCYCPPDCCKSYTNDVKYSMIIEFVGDIAVFKSVNNFVLANTKSLDVCVKGTGFLTSVDEITNMTADDLRLLM